MFDTKFLVFDTKFLVFDTKFMIFTHLTRVCVGVKVPQEPDMRELI